MFSGLFKGGSKKYGLFLKTLMLGIIIFGVMPLPYPFSNGLLIIYSFRYKEQNYNSIFLTTYKQEMYFGDIVPFPEGISRTEKRTGFVIPLSDGAGLYAWNEYGHKIHFENEGSGFRRIWIDNLKNPSVAEYYAYPQESLRSDTVSSVTFLKSRFIPLGWFFYFAGTIANSLSPQEIFHDSSYPAYAGSGKLFAGLDARLLDKVYSNALRKQDNWIQSEDGCRIFDYSGAGNWGQFFQDNHDPAVSNSTLSVPLMQGVWNLEKALRYDKYNPRFLYLSQEGEIGEAGKRQGSNVITDHTGGVRALANKLTNNKKTCSLHWNPKSHSRSIVIDFGDGSLYAISPGNNYMIIGGK